MAKMMLKDLHLAEHAAQATHATTPLATAATALYTELCAAGLSEKDFSIMMEWLKLRNSNKT
jgi:3-hydroxyisobutyrate dehydrogenase